MKKYVLSAIIFSFAIFISSVSTNAQNPIHIKVEIPFEFSVADKTFKAGNYILIGLNNQSGIKVFQLRDEEDKARVIFYTQSVASNSKAENLKISLFFRRYGNRNFLSGISDPAIPMNVEIMKSKNEVLVAKNFKKNNSEISSITLNK